MDVILDRRLLYSTADLRSKKLIGDRRFSTDSSWVVGLGLPVLIRLAKTKDDVRILSYERNGGLIHEFEAAGVVGFCESVNIGEAVWILG